MITLAESKRTLFCLPATLGGYALLRPLLFSLRAAVPGGRWDAWLGRPALGAAAKDGIFGDLRAYPEIEGGFFSRRRIIRYFITPSRNHPYDLAMNYMGEPVFFDAAHARLKALLPSDGQALEAGWTTLIGNRAMPPWNYQWPDTGGRTQAELDMLMPEDSKTLSCFWHQAERTEGDVSQSLIGPVFARMSEVMKQHFRIFLFRPAPEEARMGPGVRLAEHRGDSAGTQWITLPRDLSPELACAAMSRCQVVLTSDALGLMTACAAGRPTLALWPDSDIERWRPLLPGLPLVLLGSDHLSGVGAADIFQWLYALIGEGKSAVA